MGGRPAVVRWQRGHDGNFSLLTRVKTRCGRASSPFESYFFAVRLDGHVSRSLLSRRHSQLWIHVSLGQNQRTQLPNQERFETGMGGREIFSSRRKSPGKSGNCRRALSFRSVAESRRRRQLHGRGYFAERFVERFLRAALGEF